jgi:hypothetical protein
MYIGAIILVLIERIKYISRSLNQRWLRLVYSDGGSISSSTKSANSGCIIQFFRFGLCLTLEYESI